MLAEPGDGDRPDRARRRRGAAPGPARTGQSALRHGAEAARAIQVARGRAQELHGTRRIPNLACRHGVPTTSRAACCPTAMRSAWPAIPNGKRRVTPPIPSAWRRWEAGSRVPVTILSGTVHSATAPPVLGEFARRQGRTRAIESRAPATSCRWNIPTACATRSAAPIQPECARQTLSTSRMFSAT